ncbi:MAG TPA: nucleotide exchange factor GrpE [Thermoanaerobaculia bacterium]|nr:nucleotide exchange factor GrpE [Thermoanaerobaculia bacterium]
MADEKRPSGNGGDDDSYVLEDTGESIEDLEHSMEIAAKEAADSTATRRAKAAAAAQDEAPLMQEQIDYKDRYLRTLADFENFRKRSEREKQDFFKYALSNLMKELLPVLDNFDRALEHAAEGDDFHRGVLLIYKQLFDGLKKHGLRPIEESGVPFDPKIHEAVVREENPNVPSHTVVAVLQKGYFLHDRLLRPAMVKVAVGGSEEAR